MGKTKKRHVKRKLAFNRALHLYPPKDHGWVPKTLEASALENSGIDKTWDLIEGFRKQMTDKGGFQQRRDAQLQYWLEQTISSHLRQQFYGNKKIKKALKLELEALRAQKTTPYHAAVNLLSLFEQDQPD